MDGPVSNSEGLLMATPWGSKGIFLGARAYYLYKNIYKNPQIRTSKLLRGAHGRHLVNFPATGDNSEDRVF
jgi:hypothetical protein